MKYCFTNEREGKKITELLSEQIDGLSLSQINRQLKLGEVRVNGKKVRSNEQLSKGDKVGIFIPEGFLKTPTVKIVYSDENIIVVYKPVNVDTENNLVRIAENQIGRKVIAVHRLDRNTEGLVILALDTETEKLLVKAIKDRKIIKIYRALLLGHFDDKEFTATAYLKKDEEKAKVSVYPTYQSGTKKIVTRFKVIEEADGYSDTEIELVTGRTHQIRAHAAFLGHPVLGDGKYSDNEINDRFGFRFQQLRAVKLIFAECEGKLGYLNGKTISV